MRPFNESLNDLMCRFHVWIMISCGQSRNKSYEESHDKLYEIPLVELSNGGLLLSHFVSLNNKFFGLSIPISTNHTICRYWPPFNFIPLAHGRRTRLLKVVLLELKDILLFSSQHFLFYTSFFLDLVLCISLLQQILTNAVYRHAYIETGIHRS